MAEISTIARPYAEALNAAVMDSKEEGLADKVLLALETLDQIVVDPALQDLINDPQVGSEQIYSLLRGMLPKEIPSEAIRLLKLLIENGRLEALPSITEQFKNLLHQDRSEAEVLIETPFPLSQEEVDSLVKALGNKFPGLKLLPKIEIDKSLIGGVKISVGDKVLDGTVKARLAEMQAALTS